MPEKEIKFILLHLVCPCCVWICHFKRSEGLGEQNDLPEVFGSWQWEQLAGCSGGLLIQREQQWLSCLLPSIITFSSISSIPCMRTGLLFLTSVSYTDPDQFVYKTRPPREQPDTFPDVMMNSYLGLWPLWWQISWLWSLKFFFWSIQSINLFMFYFVSIEAHTKSMRWLGLCGQMVVRARFHISL